MQDDTPIFEQVTEEEYNAIAQRNMRDNDFIVDDNGEGYVDNGLEDWDNVSMDSESSDDEDETAKGNSLHYLNGFVQWSHSYKNSGKKKRKKKDLVDGQHLISNMLAKQNAAQKAAKDSNKVRFSVYFMQFINSWIEKKLENDAKAMELMDDIFGDLEKDMDKKGSAAKRAKADYSAYKKPKLMKTAMSDSSAWRGPSNLDVPEAHDDNPSMDSFNHQDTDDYNHDPHGDHENYVSNPEPVEETPAPEPTIVRANTIETSTIRTGKAGKKSKLSFLPKFEREAPALEPVLKKSDTSGRQEWRDVIRESVETQPMAMSQQDTFNLSNGSDLLEADGSLQLFWFDALEKNGKVYLFGKVTID